MFGLSVWEIGLICIIILVFVRPEELPRVMRKIGNLYGKATGSSRRMMQNLQTNIDFNEDSSDSNLSIEPTAGSESKWDVSSRKRNATVDNTEKQEKE